MPRPKAFDPETALDQAMNVFWRQGYDGTSVQDLLEAMGINRFSLYDTFGDKRALFQAALTKYRRDVASEKLAKLKSADDGLEAIRSHFESQLEYLLGDGSETGCMLANACAEMAAHDALAGESIRASLERTEDAFFAALEKARMSGDLARGPGGQEQNTRDLARYLVSFANGLAVVAKAKPDRDLIEGSVRVLLESLGAVTSGWPGAPERAPRPT